jgi:hypothetical protein
MEDFWLEVEEDAGGADTFEVAVEADFLLMMAETGRKEDRLGM